MHREAHPFSSKQSSIDAERGRGWVEQRSTLTHRMGVAPGNLPRNIEVGGSTPLNTKLPRFVTPFYHPRAVATNALAADWKKFRRIYLFLPTNMIPQLIQRVKDHPFRTVLIAPWNPAEAWFPIVLNISSNHMKLQTTIYKWTGKGKTLHPSGKYLPFLFCGRSSSTASP